MCMGTPEMQDTESFNPNDRMDNAHRNKHFDPNTYTSLVEHTNNPMLQKFMNMERRMISEIPHKKQKTLIDIGAGYGRALPFFEGYKNILAIENNKEMFAELGTRTSSLKHAKAIF